MSGDWLLRGRDLDQRYARFAKTLLTDQEIWNLAKAGIVCDGDPRIAMMLWLTSRSQTLAYAIEIKEWALMVGGGITRAMYKPRGGKRRRQYSEIENPNVLRQASLDGAAIAMFGPLHVPALFERRKQFNVDERTYRKVRDFVWGVAATLVANYDFALDYAWGNVRSRVCDSIIESLSPELANDSDMFRGESEEIPNYKLASGCALTPPAPASDSVEAWQEE